MTHALHISAAEAALAVPASLPAASLLDTASVLAGVLLPTIAKGPINRRPKVMAIAERLQLDGYAIRVMQRVRYRYGAGPVMLRIPGRRIAMLLDPDDVHRVLEQSPEPFALDVREKRAALSHFEPKSVLISRGPERADRRRYNEEVLDTSRPVHRLGSVFREVVASEAERLRDAVRADGELSWSNFSPVWFRVVRRVVFGDAATEDHELSSVMSELRYAANWAFLRPQKPALRERLLERIRHYLRRADERSLAGVAAAAPTTRETAPEHQVPQWLFAFDPAGMATFRALALLASHPEQGRRARMDEALRRAAVLESLRLWPTTPLLLRESTSDTAWPDGGRMPAGTGIVIFTPFFHRDDEYLPFANRFAPELWTHGQQRHRWPLVPFSEGPGVCPGRNLVLLLTSTMLGELLARMRVRLRHPSRMTAEKPLPSTLNHFAIRFDVRLAAS